MCDTFTVKLLHGNQGVGRSSRKAIKVQVLSDTNRFVYSVTTSPANIHDSKILTNTLPHIHNLHSLNTVLMDSAYVGPNVQNACLNKGLIPIIKPKNNANGLPSHVAPSGSTTYS